LLLRIPGPANCCMVSVFADAAILKHVAASV
jgi:hypothetical protein